MSFDGKSCPSCSQHRTIEDRDEEIATLKQRLAEQPTKAPARDSDTTFVPTVRAQTTEGMLDAARAEIAALRAECARNARALKLAMDSLRKHDHDALADITKILQEP